MSAPNKHPQMAERRRITMLQMHNPTESSFIPEQQSQITRHLADLSWRPCNFLCGIKTRYSGYSLWKERGKNLQEVDEVLSISLHGTCANPLLMRLNNMFEGLFQPMQLLVILAVAVLFFVPKKLPELGRGLGDAISGFKKAVREADSTSNAR
jgi:TatA/E family protein of Tat protein translocase